MRLLSRLALRAARTLVLVPLMLTVVYPVSAQTTTSDDTIQLIAQRQNAISQTYKLERAAQGVMYLETLALLAAYGGWSRYDAAASTMGGGKRLEYLKLQEMMGGLKEDVIHAKTAVQRNKSVSEDELRLVSDISTNVETLSAVAFKVGDLLKAEKIDEANALYRDKSIDLINKIDADSYTLISTLQKKIDKTALLARLAK